MVERHSDSPYQDPELITRSGGNQRLLSRLVALKIAEHTLADDPDNESLRNTRDIMQEEVDKLEQM